MTTVFYGCMYNGFSGLPMFDFFYYSLVAVLNTDVLPMVFMATDQPVDFLFE